MIDIPIPNHAIGDGVFTFLIFVEGNSVPVSSFCISAGRAMEYDLRAEVALLRGRVGNSETGVLPTYAIRGLGAAALRVTKHT